MKNFLVLKPGFTLIETVVVIGIVGIAISAISTLFTMYLRLTSAEKFKITAASLANQKIETVRNLPYNLIGTLSGIPAGNIPQEETVISNGITYNVSTEILYIDDPFDGSLNPGELDSPYQPDGEDVIFYWNMNSASSGQSPQVGSGSIMTSPGLTTAIGVKDNGLLFSPPADMDIARISATNNIDTTKGRIGFWYKPEDKNISDDVYFIAASGCSGTMILLRENSNKLQFIYGASVGTLRTIASHPQTWDIDHWYFIEIMWDDTNNEMVIFRDNEEISYSSTEISAPSGCNNINIGNVNEFTQDPAGGIIDEFYILNNPNPSSVPLDLLNTDYKRIKVTVSWKTDRGTDQIFMISDIAPPGIETTVGGGTLVLTVFDSEGSPVSQANIAIDNTVLDPLIDLDLTTNSDGEIIIPGMPPDDNYYVYTTKTGYSIDQTYAPTTSYPTPVRPLLSVVEESVSRISFAIDRVSNLNVKTVSRTLPGNWQVNSTPTSSDHILSQIATTNSNFYYTWQDYRDSSTTPLTYGQKYSSLGANQWGLDVKISTQTNQFSPQITLDSSENVYYSWYDNSNSNYTIYLHKYLSDGTANWAEPKKVTANLTANQTNPGIIYDSGQIHVVWQDDRNDYGDIYFNTLDTDGNRMLTNDVKLNTDSGSNIQSKPKIKADSDNNLLVAWLDDRSGESEIYLTKINSAGTKLWGNEQKVNSESPAVSHDNFDFDLSSSNNIFVTWSDSRSLQHSIYWQEIASSSAKIHSNDQALNVQATSSQQIDPQLAVDDNDEIFIAWQDDRNGDQDIYLTKMDTSGTLFWTNEIQLNLEFSGDQEIGDIGVYNTDSVAITWTDYDEGVGNIWTGNFDGSITETPIPFVDFNLQGSKLIYQNPDMHKHDVNYTTDANGLLLIGNMEWDVYTLTVTDSSYTLGSSEPESPFLLPAGTTTDLIIFVE